VRLILTHPHFWPHVRRGAEREVHDLGARLAARGDEVTVLTSMPEGVARRRRLDGMRVQYLRRPPLPGVTAEAASVPLALPAIAATPGDLVAAFHYADGWAAVQARRVRRRPVVLKLTGTVEQARMADVRYDRRLFRDAVAAADEVWCNSEYAREAMAWTGRDMAIVPAGVDLGRFRATTARSAAPTVLCTSAPADPRKRLVDVVAAWPAVLAAEPAARLRIAGAVGADVRRALLDGVAPAVAGSIEIAGPLDDDALVDAYSSAWVTVAPAVAEALGLTTLESLACGTPVAGARSGATPEIVDSGDVGVLYPPGDVDACASAVVGALRLAGGDGVRTACRAVAARWDWDVIATDVSSRFARLVHRS
jgi:glycosyltransferase involved in cell wall biosynthesis